MSCGSDEYVVFHRARNGFCQKESLLAGIASVSPLVNEF